VDITNITHYLRHEPQISGAINEITETLITLVHRLEIHDLPGLSLSADQAALMAQVLRVTYRPPRSQWSRSWDRLLSACEGLSGYKDGLLNADPDVVESFQRALQEALDSIQLLTEAFQQLETE